MDHSPDPFHSSAVCSISSTVPIMVLVCRPCSLLVLQASCISLVVYMSVFDSLSLNWRQFHVFSSSAALSQRFPCCSSCFSTFCKVTLFQNLCSSRNYLPTVQLLPCYLQVHSKGHFCRKTLTEQFVAVSYSSQRFQLKKCCTACFYVTTC